jgi:hypothetical protein
MKEDLIMKSNHISIAMTLFTVIKVILAGEKNIGYYVVKKEYG